MPRLTAGDVVILPNLRRTVENRRFSRRTQEYQIKDSHRILGHCLPCRALGECGDRPADLGHESHLEGALRHVVE